MRLEYLSHVIGDDLPVYGGRASARIGAVKTVRGGDSCNTFAFYLENHWGTHIDLPAHFFDGGKRVQDMPASYWFFERPRVISVKLAPSEMLEPGKWMDGIGGKADIVLLRSGWGRLRGKRAYTAKNPGIAPGVAGVLRERFPLVRAIGIDWISISPYEDRDAGRASHRAFLDPRGHGKPVSLIEDMDMSRSLASLKKMDVVPLRVARIDSAPCTVIGHFDD